MKTAPRYPRHGHGLQSSTSPHPSPITPDYPSIERRENLPAAQFFAEYAAKNRPVLLPGLLRDCPALSRWSFDHLRAVSGERMVKLKQGLADDGVAALNSVDARLGDYLDALEHQATDASPAERLPYLHDVPLTSVLPEAAVDLQGLAAEYFPPWYRARRWQFAQFFLGPRHSLTPLHFDCLLTHNLFFQVIGRKRFILLPYEQLAYCYRYRWRWCAVDAEQPDFDRHPLYRQAQPQACIVEPGDALYMPPGMLHHVRSLDTAMSFNVNWHTPDSALRGVLAVGRGMPLKNAYYNALIALGLWSGISAARVLPWYRAYLNYVS